MSETSLDIRIRPGIAPDARHQLEDAIANLGLDIAGGGGFDDGSESDIMAYSMNVRSDLPQVMKLLQSVNIGQESCVVEDGKHEHSVYGPITVPPKKPWWRFW